MRPRVRSVLATVALSGIATGLAACVDSDPPGESPADRPARPSADSSAGPNEPLEPPEPPSNLALDDARFRVGPPEIVMGPSPYVDSPLTAIKVGDTVRGYVGNVDTVLLEGASAADLAPTDRVVIGRGETKSDFDWCGAWLDAVVPDARDPDLLRAWYHAESDCAYADNETHKSIAYAESRDGGLTFTKPDYPDNQVVRSPTGGADGVHTGRGAPSVVRRGDFLYLYYLNVLPDLSTVNSVARAPVSSGGVPGSWRNYTEDGWTGDALDGPAAALDTTVPARSASIHTPSDSVVLVRQHSPSGGIVLQSSTDGIHFTELPEPLVPYLESQVSSDWGQASAHQIFGYVSIVAPDGSTSWDDEFYLFHMYVFPGDGLRDGRYLVRRHVVVDEAPDGEPHSTVALSGYTDPLSGDQFQTSAPLKPGPASEGVVGDLLGLMGSGRTALFECTTAGGDRFVAAGCGATGVEGRLVGYSFTTEQPGTELLVRCATDDGDQYVALESSCSEPGVGLGWIYPPGS